MILTHWWHEGIGHGYVTPKPRHTGDQVTKVKKISDDQYCVEITPLARIEIGVEWGCVDTRSEDDAKRITEMVARLVVNAREAEANP